MLLLRVAVALVVEHLQPIDQTRARFVWLDHVVNVDEVEDLCRCWPNVDQAKLFELKQQYGRLPLSEAVECARR